MVAMVKAGVELAFETMVSAGIIEESAYYESLHETPLIANTIARKKLYEMNVVISDTAEYGCYLFDHACRPLLADFMADIETDVIGRGMGSDCTVDNQELIRVNDAIRCAPGGGRGQDPAGPHDGYEEHPLKNAAPLEGAGALAVFLRVFLQSSYRQKTATSHHVD
jgi:hypothetical protein